MKKNRKDAKYICMKQTSNGTFPFIKRPLSFTICGRVSEVWNYLHELRFVKFDFNQMKTSLLVNRPDLADSIFFATIIQPDHHTHERFLVFIGLRTLPQKINYFYPNDKIIIKRFIEKYMRCEYRFGNWPKFISGLHEPNKATSQL